MDREKEIIYLDIEEIIPYENNPRFNDEAVDKVAGSIKEFGFLQPVVVNTDGVLIVGHTRIKAAEQVGMTEVPAIIADDLTEAQEKAYRLADNKTSEFAEWDWSSLEQELSKITEIDMKVFGFDEALPDIDISDVFEEYYNQEDDYQEDGKEYLEWQDKKVAIDDSDIAVLNREYDDWKEYGTGQSFVAYILKE